MGVEVQVAVQILVRALGRYTLALVMTPFAHIIQSISTRQVRLNPILASSFTTFWLGHRAWCVVLALRFWPRAGIGMLLWCTRKSSPQGLE